MTSRARWVACLALVAAVGCGWRKQHLSKDHGRSYDAVFAAQRAGGKPTPAVTGLDSQEAAIVSGAYRAGLAPKGQKGAEQPVLLLAPSARERPQPLAPSVPGEKVTHGHVSREE